MSTNKILIVEQSEAQRMLLTDYLQSRGLHPIAAQDGVQALQQFKQHKPKLVLLELVLPKLNGFEVLRRLKRFGKEKPVVVIMSATGDKSNQLWAKRQGADGYLVKPFHPHQLLEMIRRFTKPTIKKIIRAKNPPISTGG